MLNSAILLKVKLRLNKLASNDYDNIEDWVVLEAFNKAQVDWCRRNLHGLNITKEGDEQSTRRIDDFQKLLTTYKLNLVMKDKYQEASLPDNYLHWKRVSANATSDCCTKPAPMVIYLAEHANVDILLTDSNKKPDFLWGESFATLSGGKIQLYHNNEFEFVKPALLLYYKQPNRISISGVDDIYKGNVSTLDEESELKEDLIELIIDETVKILSSDIEALIQTQRSDKSVESNN